MSNRKHADVQGNCLDLSMMVDIMPKMFQINEEDLGELEKFLPELAEAVAPLLNNRLRVKQRRCKSIISNIRWNYGPSSETEIIALDDD